MDFVVEQRQSGVHAFPERPHPHFTALGGVVPPARAGGGAQLELVVNVLVPVLVKDLVEHVRFPRREPFFVGCHARPFRHRGVVFLEEALHERLVVLIVVFEKSIIRKHTKR